MVVVVVVVVVLVVLIAVMIMMMVNIVSSGKVSLREHFHVSFIQTGSSASRAIICNPIALNSMG